MKAVLTLWSDKCLGAPCGWWTHQFRTASLSDHPQMEPPNSITLHSLQSDYQSMNLRVLGMGKGKGKGELNIYQNLAGSAFWASSYKIALIGSYFLEWCVRMGQNIKRLHYPSFNPDIEVLTGPPSTFLIIS